MRRPLLIALIILSAISPFRYGQAQGNGKVDDAARRVTDLGKLAAVSSVAKRTLTAKEIPFLSPPMGATVWDVTFAPMRLHFDSQERGVADRYERKFVATFDSMGKHLVIIRSRFDGVDPDLPGEPSPEEMEALLPRSGDESYASFPDIEPKITFLKALESVQKGGMGSPFLAKEIDGLYVMRRKMGKEARAVWVITLRGIPAIPMKGLMPGPHAVQPPKESRIRNIVDAVTGQCLSAQMP